MVEFQSAGTPDTDDADCPSQEAHHLDPDNKALKDRALPHWFIVLRIVLRSILMPLSVVALLFGTFALLQWGVNGANPYVGQPYETKDLFNRDAFLDPRTGYFAAPCWSFRPVLNFIILALVFTALLFLINHFWIALATASTLSLIIAVAERIKTALRGEAILPTDITLAAGTAQEIGSFIPQTYLPMIRHTVYLVLIIWATCILLKIALGNDRIVAFSARPPRLGTRALGVIIPIMLLQVLSVGLGTVNSPIYTLARNLGDSPALWSSLSDTQQNGVSVSFLRFMHTQKMNRPANYSEKTMRSIANKYQQSANTINETHKTPLTDTTLITVLSESFSDPTRVPGLQVNQDPIPFLHGLKSQATSGLMLSAGYGGGTANLEYQELTGLSTALFSPSLVTPYMQLVPQQKDAYSNNQLWNTANKQKPNPLGTKGKSDNVRQTGSIAIHPYTGAVYHRRGDYMQQFLFRYFYTNDGPTSTRVNSRNQSKIDRNPYVSDEGAYSETVDRLNKIPQNQQVYVQLTTIQNHMPYSNWYNNNQFQVSGSNGHQISPDEAGTASTYAKGANYTDQATQQWLEQLDNMNRPIVVVWYGDHLPGIYDAEIGDDSNSLPLHETDYFIWSNKAALRNGALAKLPDQDAAYTSPNFFIAQAAQQANAKVSPYLAFLTDAHRQISAMEPTLQTTDDFSSNTEIDPNTYLDSSGKQINSGKMTKEQRQVLNDYRLIQYDMTIGHHYLRSLGFLNLPKE